MNDSSSQRVASEGQVRYPFLQYKVLSCYNGWVNAEDGEPLRRGTHEAADVPVHERLNELGAQGWMLCGTSGSYIYLVRHGVVVRPPTSPFLRDKPGEENPMPCAEAPPSSEAFRDHVLGKPPEEPGNAFVDARRKAQAGSSSQRMAEAQAEAEIRRFEP